MSISIEELRKAVQSLKIAIDLYKEAPKNSDSQTAFRDACIKRFEYSIEISWKSAMKILGSKTVAAKPAIREMGRSNLIDDPEKWLGFIEARNETSHSYDEDVATRVFQQIELFYPEALQLISRLEKIQ